MVTVESAGLSDVGRKREANEDRICVDDDLGLYLVADGMGGHQAGEIASELVVSAIRDFLKAPGPGITPRKGCGPEGAGRLLAGIRWSNQVVHEASLSRADRQGMGSTVAAVYFCEDRLVAANIGDSPIYLVRNGGIDALSVPHTLQADLASQTYAPFLGNVLTRAVGPKASVDADLCEISCYKHDVLVLCSDGLSNKVAPPEILAVVSAQPPREACRTLVELANRRGGEDNISVVAVRVARVQRNGHAPWNRWVLRLKRALTARRAAPRR
ncbi:MAG: protein phosphatase 2C domain-containing protein [Desulfobacterales bacterium]